MRAPRLLAAASAAALSLAAVPLLAQATIAVEQLSCMRTGDNQVVHATAANQPAGGSGRLYFKWSDHGDKYWVELQDDGIGRYWTTPPKPESRNTKVEYYAVLLDGAGAEVARSAVYTAKVTGDCKVQLTPQQYGWAQNLTIGETSPKQVHNRVEGFLCDGIVTRVNPENIRRADETCRACAIAWWQRKEILIPLIAAGAGGITTIVVDHPESSPSRP
jgi:hypothetical protein